MGAIAAILERRRQEEEEEEEKNREEVFPCMMTDGLYLDDATQRGREGEVARKKQKGNISALTTRSNREDKINLKLPHHIAIGVKFPRI